MDAGHTKSRVLQERTNCFILPKSSTSHRPKRAMEPHIQAMLTPLATRKAQLQRTLSAARPISLAKPSGSALAKGETKPSRHLKRDDSVEGRNTRMGKDLIHGLPVNAFSVEDEAKSSGLPVSTYLDEKLADISRRPSLSHTSSRSSPRSMRYYVAEKALAAALKCSQESKSTVDLQIDALRRATSVLNTRISDAADQVEKLRGLLANRAADPGIYQSMQRQRWMEEKRKLAAEHLSNVLKQHLTTLSSLRPPSQASAQVQSLASASNSKAKANSNLIAFLESSSSCQRISTRNRARHVFVPPRPRSPEKVDSLPRIHNHKQLLPLRLKVSITEPLFQQSKPNTMNLTPPPPTSVQGSTSTFTISPPTSSPSTPKSSASHLTPIQEAPDSDDVDPVPYPLPHNPSSPNISDDDSGTAMIWHSSPRSAADILSDFSVSVELPKYVADLLSTFEANTSVSAGSGLRFLSDLSHSENQGRTSPRALHTASSFRRISALFSLGEGFSGVEGHGLSTRLKRRMSGLRR